MKSYSQQKVNGFYKSHAANKGLKEQNKKTKKQNL